MNTSAQQYPEKTTSTLTSLFEQADNSLWDSTTRSIRISGTVTSVRLENFFWRVLGEMASEASLQIPQLLTALSKQSNSPENKLTNFTSFVRVSCGCYLETKISRQTAVEDSH